MTNKQDIISQLESPSSEVIDEFVLNFGNNIRSIVIDNGASNSLYKELLLNVICELIFRLKNRISFQDYDAEIIVNTLAYLFMIKNKSARKKPMVYSVNHYELRSFKLLSFALTSYDEKCEKTLKGIGEPGRTILKLSFFEKMKENEIAEHVQFDSVGSLQQRRVKLVDTCVDNLL